MAPILDPTTVMGAAFTAITNTVTGSTVITIFLLIIIALAAGIGLGLPVELLIVFAVPLLIAFAMMTSGLPVLILYIALFFLAIIFTKRFILNG